MGKWLMCRKRFLDNFFRKIPGTGFNFNIENDKRRLSDETEPSSAGEQLGKGYPGANSIE